MPSIAVCLYGKEFDQSKIEKIESYFYMLLKENNNISFFKSFTDIDMMENLCNICWHKQTHEFENKVLFDSCLAINSDLFLDYSDPLIDVNNLEDLENPNINTLYFLTGTSKRFIEIEPTGFFCNSFIFDLVCNYSFTNLKIDEDRLGGIPRLLGERFYWFIKSFKIKTQCINYENSNLFKRSTSHN